MLVFEPWRCAQTGQSTSPSALPLIDHSVLVPCKPTEFSQHFWVDYCYISFLVIYQIQSSSVSMTYMLLFMLKEALHASSHLCFFLLPLASSHLILWRYWIFQAFHGTLFLPNFAQDHSPTMEHPFSYSMPSTHCLKSVLNVMCLVEFWSIPLLDFD